MSLALNCLSLLPRWLRLPLLRRQMSFSESDLRGVVVKVVDSTDDALAASHILHRAYVRRGLVTPHASGLRVTPHAILPTTFTFVAIHEERYVGTLSLVGDGALGLPMDRIYSAELAAFRSERQRLAEVGSLAILPAFRKKGIAWLLYRLMYETAHAHGVERLVAAVHPDARDIYQAALLFEQFGEERSYPGLNRSARSVAINLDLRGALARFESAFRHLPSDTTNPYYLCITSERPEIVRRPPLADVEYVAIARALVGARTDVFDVLPWDVRAQVRSALPSVRLTVPDVEPLPLLSNLVPA